MIATLTDRHTHGWPVKLAVIGSAPPLVTGARVECRQRHMMPPPVGRERRSLLVDLAGAVGEPGGQTREVGRLGPERQGFELGRHVQRPLCDYPGIAGPGKVGVDPAGAGTFLRCTVMDKGAAKIGRPVLEVGDCNSRSCQASRRTY
jgi:hypothetical protein